MWLRQRRLPDSFLGGRTLRLGEVLQQPDRGAAADNEWLRLHARSEKSRISGDVCVGFRWAPEAAAAGGTAAPSPQPPPPPPPPLPEQKQPPPEALIGWEANFSEFAPPPLPPLVAPPASASAMPRWLQSEDALAPPPPLEPPLVPPSEIDPPPLFLPNLLEPVSPRTEFAECFVEDKAAQSSDALPAVGPHEPPFDSTRSERTAVALAELESTQSQGSNPQPQTQPQYSNPQPQYSTPPGEGDASLEASLGALLLVGLDGEGPRDFVGEGSLSSSGPPPTHREALQLASQPPAAEAPVAADADVLIAFEPEPSASELLAQLVADPAASRQPPQQPQPPQPQQPQQLQQLQPPQPPPPQQQQPPSPPPVAAAPARGGGSLWSSGLLDGKHFF